MAGGGAAHCACGRAALPLRRCIARLHGGAGCEGFACAGPGLLPCGACSKAHTIGRLPLGSAAWWGCGGGGFGVRRQRRAAAPVARSRARQQTRVAGGGRARARGGSRRRVYGSVPAACNGRVHRAAACGASERRREAVGAVRLRAARRQNPVRRCASPFPLAPPTCQDAGQHAPRLQQGPGGPPGPCGEGHCAARRPCGAPGARGGRTR